MHRLQKLAADLVPLKPFGSSDNGKICIDRDAARYRQDAVEELCILLSDDPSLSHALLEKQEQNQEILKPLGADVATYISPSELRYLSSESLAHRVMQEVRIFCFNRFL